MGNAQIYYRSIPHLNVTQKQASLITIKNKNKKKAALNAASLKPFLQQEP